ncbi:hypothetical protein [Tellurirhabdus bombi]|uniref:hypothetical protein n=1 Tax=Tellurirhabdus bombi TaxID=2907205 RepID=UPI001F3B73AB|nr:hypothetical protein [Tellurirhabdus bombi]
MGVLAQTEGLKPIQKENQTVTWGTQYGPRHQSQTTYFYDGIEVRRVTELGKYILASGNPDAIREYRKFTSSRRVGTGLIVVGGVTSVIGAVITFSSNSDSRRDIAGIPIYQNGLYYSNGMAYSRNPFSSQQSEKKSLNRGGIVTMASGLTVLLVGSIMHRPGLHLRRSVQYYNRALENRVSLKLEPHWDNTNAGLGLVARF